jgi:AcrR family transcriptional regulator
MVRPRQVTDRDLLWTARKCFLEHGPAVSTSVIAERAGVSQATLFKRFGTKKKLMVQALMPDHDGPQWEAMLRAPDARPIPEQLVEKGLIVIAFFSELQPRIAMLRACGTEILEELHADGQTPPPVRALRAMQSFFDAAIASERMRTVPTETLALTWLGALRNRAFFTHMMPSLHLDGDDATYVQELTDMLWRGMRPVEES